MEKTKLAERMEVSGRNWPSQLMSASAYATPTTTTTAWSVELTLLVQQQASK
jgi:hypothetical protein